MSNYLDNLVARHLDKSTVVQPRLASLFEPPHKGASTRAPSNVVEPFEFDSLSEEGGDAGLVESRRSAEASFNSDLHGSRTQASSNESLMTVWRGRQSILPSSFPEASPIEPAEGFIPVSVQPHPPHTQTPIAKPANEQSTIANAPSSSSNRGDAAPPQNLRQHSREPVATKVAPAAVQNDARAPGVSLHLRQPRLEPLPVDSTGEGIVVYPRIASRAETRNARNDATSPSYLNDPPAAPTINVTIGRVEVRATLPATSPRKQSPTAPLMGLDEYLRKRAKGDGR